MSRNPSEPAEESTNSGPAVFEPDTLLPVQFAMSLRHKKGLVEGEKRLLAAVLTDAVDCYMKYLDAQDNRSRQIFADAEAWILDDVIGGVFSFRGICEVLGLEPEYVRRGLVDWRLRARASRVAAPRMPSRSEDEDLPPLKAAG